MNEIAFHVPGVPAPQGSMKTFARKGFAGARVTHSNPQTMPWRAAVQEAAADIMRAYELPVFETGVLALEACFAFPRPKAHYSARGGLKPSAPIVPETGLDTDKLVRAIGDALNGVCYRDDAQIGVHEARRIYAGAGQVSGVALWLRPWALDEQRCALRRYTELAGISHEQPLLRLDLG